MSGAGDLFGFLGTVANGHVAFALWAIIPVALLIAAEVLELVHDASGRAECDGMCAEEL
jgi:hypothetical protein